MNQKIADPSLPNLWLEGRVAVITGAGEVLDESSLVSLPGQLLKSFW
jgi:hypothetical protein